MSMMLQGRGKANKTGWKAYKVLAAILTLAVIFAGYMAYNRLSAKASVLQLFLAADGVALNGATTDGGFTNTESTTADTVYFSIYENTDGINKFTWDFDTWDPLTGVTADKVTRLELVVNGNMIKNGDPGTGADETIEFAVYNWNTEAYDLTLGTQRFNSLENQTYTLSGPAADYSNYFSPGGELRIKMDDVTDNDGFASVLQLDFIYVNVYYDTTSPTATWESPSGTYYTNANTIQLEVYSNDTGDEQSGISRVDYYYGSDTLIGSDTIPESVTPDVGTWVYNMVYNWIDPAEGTYSVYARAYDGKNNVSVNTAAQSIVVDRTSPDAELTSLAPGDHIKGTVSVQGTADDAHFRNYKLEYAPTGDTTWTEIVANQTTPVNGGNLCDWNTTTMNGVYDIRLTVTDLANNTSSTVVNNVYVDNTAPSLSLQYFSDSSLSTPLLTDGGGIPMTTAGTVYVKLVSDETLKDTAGANQLTITSPLGVNDVTTASFTYDSGVSAWVYVWTVSSGGDGEATAEVKGTDLAGNESTVLVAGDTVTIDTTAPAFSLEYYSDSGLGAGSQMPNYDGKPIAKAGTVYVKLVPNEPLAETEGANQLTVNALGDANDVTTASFTYNAGVSAWVYAWTVSSGNDCSTDPITVKATDRLGNSVSDEPTSGDVVIIDSTVETATISAPLTGTYIKGVCSVTGAAYDTHFGHYRVEYAPTGTYTGWTSVDLANPDKIIAVNPGELASWNTTVLNGVYDIKLTVWDAAYNVSSTVVNRVYVDNTAPVLNLEYYSDPSLQSSTKLPTSGGKPVTKAGTVYVKLVSNETLDNTAGANQITITSPLGINNVTDAPFTWNAGVSAWVYTWTVQAGGDGEATVEVKGTDLAGNVADGPPFWTGKTVLIDCTVTVANITAPTENSFIKGIYAVTGTATDANFKSYKVEYSVAGNNLWTKIGPDSFTQVSGGVLTNWTTTLLNGKYDLKLTVSDIPGNTISSVVQNVYVDNTRPTLSIQYYSDAGLTEPLPVVSGKPAAKAGTVYIKLVTNETLRSNAGDNQVAINAPGTINDLVYSDFTWNGSVNSWVYAWNVSSGSDGTATVSVKGTDLAGNITNSYSVPGQVITIDTTAPTFDLLYYSDSGLNSSVPTLSGKPLTKAGTTYIKLSPSETLRSNPGDNQVSINAPGNLSDIENASFTWNAGVGAWVYAWQIQTETSGDTAPIKITGTDLAGNVALNVDPTTGGTLTVDTVIPTANVTAPPAKISGSYTISGSAEDETAMNYYKLEYYKVGTGPWTQIGSNQTTPVNNGTLITWNTTTVPDGNYDIRLTVVDKAGNLTTSAVNTTTIDNSPPELRVEYYTDNTLNDELLTYKNNPVTKARDVYIRLVSNELLRDNAGDTQISITAPGAANSVVNGEFTWDESVDAWVYKWTVNNDGNDGNATVTVKGVDLLGNIYNNTPVSGGVVTIDNQVADPIISYTALAGELNIAISTEPDQYRYYIYRSTVDGFTPGEGNLVDTVAAMTDYTAPLPPEVYYYRVKVIDLAGNVSGYSGQIKIYEAAGPLKPIIRYRSNGEYVSISVYWDDTGGGSIINWADSVILSGGNLDWRNTGLSISGLGSDTAVAVLETAIKYRNYYFRLAKGGKSSIFRTFPANFDNTNGPRYQNDYAHGNFTFDTAMCSKCHSTHNSLKAQLLNQATYYELCLTCHGNSSTQSKYDVQMGKTYTGVAWVDSLAGPIGNGIGTSSHNIDDRNSVDTTVYGSDPAQILTFTCVSCHVSHGGADDNYRLIRKTIYPSNNQLWNPQTVNFRAFAVVNDLSVGEEAYYVSGASEFCAACHLDYIKGNAYTPGGVYSSVYRHPITVGNTVYSVETKNYWPTPGTLIPLQYYSGASTDDKRTAVVCETCHFAHGTRTNFSVYVPPEPLPFIKKNMLRVDNFGVCEACHKK